ncbi:MAG: THUMP domain-containing protein [Promethearchaeota archaeon]
MLLNQYFNNNLNYYLSIYSEYFEKYEFTDILSRYSEIGLKSDKIRRRMEKSLIEGVRINLEKRNLELTKYSLERGRIVFSFRKEDIKLGSFILLNTPGIKSISPVLKTDTNIRHILNKCTEYAEPIFRPRMSLGVKVKIIKRSKFPDENPRSISEKISNQILSRFPPEERGSINIASPDLKIYLEIRDKFTFIYSKKIYGISPGLPVENERASIANVIEGRFHDYDAIFRILARGQHILPVVFQIEKNEYSNVNKSLLEIFHSFYPINNMYIIRIKLKSILKIIKSQLKGSKQIYICPLCRFFRLGLLTTINMEQRQIISRLKQKLKQKTGFDQKNAINTTNVFKRSLRQKKRNKESRKILINKFNRFKGIVNGEGDGMFCPSNEDIWKTTAWLLDPLIQPELILSEEEIKKKVSDILISGIILEELSLERLKLKGNNNTNTLIKKCNQQISNYYGVFNMLEKTLTTEICDYKSSIEGFNLEEFIILQKKVGIKQLITNTIKKCTMVQLF